MKASLVPLFCALALVVVVSGCTTAPPHVASSRVPMDGAEASRDEAMLAAAAAHAAAPVHTVRFLQPIHSMELLGQRAVLVWETPFKAWLVDLRPSASCSRLDNTVALGIDTMSDTLNDSNGWIEGEHGIRCKIEQIREVDVPSMRATMRANGQA